MNDTPTLDERNAEIYDLKQRGESLAKLAHKYGLSKGRVVEIVESEKLRRLPNHDPGEYITHLKLPKRIIRALHRYDVVTQADLIYLIENGQTKEGETNVRNFGRKSLYECITALQWAGVYDSEMLPEQIIPSYHFLEKGQWDECLGYWNHKCAVCGKPEEVHRRLAQDHWIPQHCHSFPGSAPYNMVPLCTQCNVKKASQGPLIWMVGELGHEAALDKMREILDYFDWWRDRLKTEET